MRRTLPLAAVILLAACGARRPTYVPLDLPLPEQPRGSGDTVRANVEWAMERGRMPRLTWTPNAELPPRSIGPKELEAVPESALWVAWVCSPRRMWGAELDLVVHEGEQAVPVTVQVDVDGGVHLVRGRELEPVEPPDSDRALWMQELARRHGLGAVVDGDRSWTGEELAVLSDALDLLDPRERLLLEGLVLSRDGFSPRDPRELALYDPIIDPPVIHVYDGAFLAGTWSFVGAPDAPQPAAVMTIVHEFGHVVSDAPIATAWDRYTGARWSVDQAPPDERDLARQQLTLARKALRQVGRRGPVINDFDALRPGRHWPTAWSTDVYESFAEAFALWKTDADALLRVAPEAHAWFSEGGHLAWRTFPE